MVKTIPCGGGGRGGCKEISGKVRERRKEKKGEMLTSHDSVGSWFAELEFSISLQWHMELDMLSQLGALTVE